MCNIDKLTTEYSVMFDKSEVRSSEELNTGCRVVIQDKLNNDISLCVKGAGEFLRMQKLGEDDLPKSLNISRK